MSWSPEVMDRHWKEELEHLRRHCRRDATKKQYDYHVRCPICDDQVRVFDENPLEEDVIFRCDSCGDEMAPSECVVEVYVRPEE